MTVSPSNARNTHHIRLYDATVGGVDLVLCDGGGRANGRSFTRTPYPQSALKTYTGPQQWSDLEPPWTHISQADWSGGGGRDVFDVDERRYWQGYYVDATQAGRLVLAGRPVPTVLTKGERHWPAYNTALTAPARQAWYSLHHASITLAAFRFVASSSYTGKALYLWLRKVGAPGDLRITLRSETAGAPDATVYTITVAASGYDAGVGRLVRLDTSVAVTNGTAYYWVFTVVSSSTDYWDVGLAEYSGTVAQTFASATWSAALANWQLMHYFAEQTAPGRVHFASFKGGWYGVTAPDAQAASTLRVAGEQGAATGGSTSTLVDAAKSWATNEWAGCVCVLGYGTGNDQTRNWRVIASNTGTTLTFTDLWDVAPAANSEYSIVGSDKWTNLVSFSAGENVRDVVVHKEIIYCALGDSTDLKRFRRYNLAGTWTTETVQEAGNKAGLLAVAPNGDDTEIWAGTVGLSTSFRYAPSVDGHGNAAVADLVFSAAAPVLDNSARMTNMVPYGEQGYLYIFQENAIIQMARDGATIVPTEVIISGLREAWDWRNGRAAINSGVYLYFGFQQALERYYNGQIDDVGPNRDDGLPAGRHGYVAALAVYPGRLYAAIDAGSSGTSSVLCYNNGGWVEVFRAPAVGERIQSIAVQSVPGQPDRLWISCGAEVWWVPVSVTPLQDAAYPYALEGHVESGRMFGGLREVKKYFAALRVAYERKSSGTGARAMVQYDYASDTPAWVNLGAIGVGEEAAIAAESMWLRARLHLDAGEQSTPVLGAMTLETVARAPVKWAIGLTFRVADDDIDLLNQPDSTRTAAAKLAVIEAMVALARPVTLNGWVDQLDSRTVFVEPHSLRVVNVVRDETEDREMMVCQMTLIEV